MKTQYFRRPKRLLSPRQGIFLVVAVAVLVVFSILRFLFPGAFIAVAAPLWQVGDFFTAQSRLGGDAISLQATVDQLQAENERLRNENAVVTAQLRDQDATIMQGVTAGVMARIPLSPYDVLIVGKGSDDGVYEQMRAFSNGIPVGTVESVSGKSARIALYSAPGRESEGWLGENRIPVTVRGTGAGTFSADVSRDATVVAGDLVYIPGPGALPIGTVVSIETHPSAPRSVLSIRPMVNPFTMTNVLIVASPSP